jgi:Tfp pilus assembly protein PilF
MIHRTPTSIAVQLNNAGAVLLLRGQYNEALATFAEALKLTKVIMRNRQQLAVHDTSSGEYFHSKSLRLALSQSSLRLRNFASAFSAPRRTIQAKTMCATSMGNVTTNMRSKIETLMTSSSPNLLSSIHKNPSQSLLLK